MDRCVSMDLLCCVVLDVVATVDVVSDFVVVAAGVDVGIGMVVVVVVVAMLLRWLLRLAAAPAWA